MPAIRMVATATGGRVGRTEEVIRKFRTGAMGMGGRRGLTLACGRAMAMRGPVRMRARARMAVLRALRRSMGVGIHRTAGTA